MSDAIVAIDPEVRRAQELAQSAEQRLRAILRSFPEPIFRIARDGTYLDFAGRDDDRLVDSPSTFIGRKVADTLPPDVAPSITDAIERALATDSVTSVTYELVLEGRRRAFQTHIAPSGHEEVIAVVHEITELQRVREELDDYVAERTAELLRANRELQSLSRRLIAVQENERRRLGHELHDQIGQMLTALDVTIEACRRQAGDQGSHFDSARQIIGTLFNQVRNLSLSLRPSLLVEEGLTSALLWHVAHFSETTGLRIDFDPPTLSRIDAEIEMAGYRIVQEALTNAVRHGRASHVFLGLTASAQSVRIEIVDDGVGFESESIGLQHTIGLRGMRERAQALGGMFAIHSTPGRGARIEVELPLIQP